MVNILYVKKEKKTKPILTIFESKTHSSMTGVFLYAGLACNDIAPPRAAVWDVVTTVLLVKTHFFIIADVTFNAKAPPSPHPNV